MGTAVTPETIRALAGGTATDGLLHDPLLIGIGIGFVFVALVILAMSGLFHWALYDAPPWGAQGYSPRPSCTEGWAVGRGPAYWLPAVARTSFAFSSSAISLRITTGLVSTLVAIVDEHTGPLLAWRASTLKA